MAYVKGATGRPRGRPKKGQEPIKPEEYENIVDLVARKGWSFESVAAKYNVTRESIRNLYRNRIMPVAAGYIRSNAADLVYVNLCAIRQEAMRKYWEAAPCETVEQVAESMGDGDKAAMVHKMVRRRTLHNPICWLQLAKDCDLAIADLIGLRQQRVEGEVTFRIAGLGEDDLAEHMAGEVAKTLKLIPTEVA